MKNTENSGFLVVFGDFSTFHRDWLGVFSLFGHFDTTGPNWTTHRTRLTGRPQTPYQIPWKVSKLSKKWCFYDQMVVSQSIRFLGDILAKFDYF